MLEALARSLGDDAAWKTKDGARQIADRERGVILIEPLSFMNLSGEPTQRIAAWHKIEPEQILVIVDDLDLPFGKLRLRERGGSGGHNGLKSLIANLGETFWRLRVGIGRDASGEAIDRVLGTFSPDEEAQLPAIVDACVHGTRLWIEGQTVTAVNFLNSWQRPL